jgi:hypothetical protein
VSTDGDDTKLKSWILLFAGLAGMGFQQYTGQVNWLLLLIFASMTGVPGLAHIISLLKNSPIMLQSFSSRQELLDSESDNASPNSLKGDL